MSDMLNLYHNYEYAYRKFNVKKFLFNILKLFNIFNIEVLTYNRDGLFF